VGILHTLSIRRAGDCMRQSVGAQEEAEVAFCRNVTESGREERYGGFQSVLRFSQKGRVVDG
jgi:hypothetical protein